MITDQRTHLMGVTTLAVPAAVSLNVQVFPPRGTSSLYFKYLSGGTLAIVNSVGASTTSGYVLGSTEVFPVNGPGSFFLAASGATSVVGVVFNYSAGYSLYP